MNEAQVKHFILVERRKGTTIEELIFILHDNGVPEYEISNYLEISIKYVEQYGDMLYFLNFYKIEECMDSYIKMIDRKCDIVNTLK